MPVRPERVLIIDADLEYAQSLEQLLQLHLGEGTRTTVATSTDQAMPLIEAGEYDIALLDSSIDASHGLKLIRKGLALHPQRPFILVTGLQDSTLPAWALGAGAVDFLDKAELTPDTLLRAVRHSFDRATARDTLVEARDRFRDHFMNSGVGAWQSTLDGRMLNVNTAAAALLGYDSVEQLQTINTAALHNEPKDHEAFHRELVRAGRITHRELRLKRRDGSIIWCMVNATVSYAKGRPATIDCTLIDLTDRRFLQAQLRQAQKMEALGQLASGVAHDFNNLLTAILGYCELVLVDLPAASRMAGDVGQIQAAGERARDLTQQLLAFSRKQALRPDVLNIRNALARFDGLVPRLLGEHIQVSMHVAPDLWNVLIDPSQLEQILLNLAVNASDAMPKGGRLAIETHNVELDAEYARLHPSCVPQGQYVMLAMSDTGAGMSPAVQARAFEPFFTTKPVGKGTGLGLSTVYGIVKQTGGSIWIYSEEGHGTSFKIYFPRVTAQETRQEPATREAGGRGTETVLLVEDEDAVRALAQVVLERNGYEVLSACTAAEAISIATSEDLPIHVLLTDVVMPLMSGPQLAQRLREIRPELNVLFMSGYTANAIVDQGLLETGAPFLSKPFSPTSLALAVRSLLDGHPNTRIPKSPARQTPGAKPHAHK